MAPLTMRFCLILCCLLFFIRAMASTQHCGGPLDANNGSIQVQPSNVTCVWLIQLKDTTGIRLQFRPLTNVRINLIPEQTTAEINPQSFWTDGSRDTYNFPGKILAIVAPPRERTVSLSWAGVQADNSRGSYSTEFCRKADESLEWEKLYDGSDKIFWVIQFAANGQLNWTLESVLPQCGFANPCESISFAVFHVVPDGSVSYSTKTCEGPSMGSLETEINSHVLILLHVNSPVAARSLLKVTWKSEDIQPSTMTPSSTRPTSTESSSTRQTSTESSSTRKTSTVSSSTRQTSTESSSTRQTSTESSSTRQTSTESSSTRQTSTVSSSTRPTSTTPVQPPTTHETVTSPSDNEVPTRKVEGILAGTYGGLYVISFLNPSNPIKISSDSVQGLAFDWNSKKIYWAKGQTAIFRANLDGSGKQEVVADPDVRGLAIEPISGNLYYGSWTKKAILACDRNADRCSSIVSTDTIYDIALHLPKGFLFWSNWGKGAFKANLDGTNKTDKGAGPAYGIGVDDRENHLYWSEGSQIKYSDLSGTSSESLSGIDSLSGFTIGADVVPDDGKVYYSYNGKNEASEMSQIHFQQNQESSSNWFTTLPDKARYLSLYGTMAKGSSPRANPCGSANCAHLCILISETSYRCLCSDGTHGCTRAG